MSSQTTSSRQRRTLPGVDRLRCYGAYRLILLGFILLYIIVFTSIAFQQHAAMRTHKADLGQIDQAVWNSSRGRFVEMTDNGYVSSRLIDHVEPILALVSPVLWVWNDVRALLLLQVVFVAIGAWLLYELAYSQLMALLSPTELEKVWLAEPLRSLARPIAFTLSIAFLLTPQLQSAVLTEFHAIPLATPFILWAFVAVARRSWLQFAVAAVLLALVKEEAALLAAGLGAWAMWRILWEHWIRERASSNSLMELESPKPFPTGPFIIAALVTVAAVVWFYVATFIIVPHFAAEVYGIAESNYFQRYGALGDSPGDILKSLFTQPVLVWTILTEPARLTYLRNLAMPYGFVMVLAPEVVLLSLPVLLANALSAYPAQYYGDFHYSAPVVTFYAAGAAFGAARLWRWAMRRTAGMSGSFQHLPASGVTTMTAISAFRNSRSAFRPLITTVLVAWIAAWSLYVYVSYGRGPGGARYDPVTVTEHHRLIRRFTAQIPSEAAVTATASVHPHVSHRRYVYQFPTGLESPARADWALLDVTTDTDMAPGDLRTTVENMLAGGWGVVDAADGYLLLNKMSTQADIPAAFYDFARTRSSNPSASPLAFAGAEVDDWPRWRRSTITTRWQVGDSFDAGAMSPQIEIRTPAGEILYRFADANPPARVWYPPEMWQPGDLVTLTLLPMNLPRDWGLVIEPNRALVIPSPVVVSVNDGDALVAAYRRGDDDELVALPADLFHGITGTEWFEDSLDERVSIGVATFETLNGQSIEVRTAMQERPYWVGDDVDLWLSWSGEMGWPQNMDVFAHLRADGVAVSQKDGQPRYFVPYDITQELEPSGSVLDWRQLSVPELPESLSAETVWSVHIGLYDPATGQRARVVGADGGGVGGELYVGRIRVEAPPTPDQACALIPKACASQR